MKNYSIISANFPRHKLSTFYRCHTKKTESVLVTSTEYECSETEQKLHFAQYLIKNICTKKPNASKHTVQVHSTVHSTAHKTTTPKNMKTRIPSK